MLNNIFACYYAFGVRMKHRDPMSTAFVVFFIAEIMVLAFIGFTIDQFVTADIHSFWRSKGFLYAVAGVFAAATWGYFYGADKGTVAWERYSALSDQQKRRWIAGSIFALAGPVIGMAIVAG